MGKEKMKRKINLIVLVLLSCYLFACASAGNKSAKTALSRTAPAVSVKKGVKPGESAKDASHSDKKSPFKRLILDVISKHPQILKLKKAQNVSEQDVEIAKSGYAPVLDLSTSMGMEKTRNSTTNDKLVYKHDVLKHSLIIRQMLFDGNNVKSRIQKNRALLERSYHDIQDGQENLALRATDVYLDILRIQQQISIAEENLTAHKEILDMVQTRYDNRLVSQADVAQVQGRVALAEAELTRNQNDLSNANMIFYELTDQRPGELIEPDSPGSMLPLDLNAAEIITMKSHPAILGTIKTIDAVNASIEEAKSAFYPTVDLELIGSRSDNSGGYSNSDQSYSAMVVTNWNIFRGKADEATLAREKFRREQELEQLKETKRSLLRDLATAWETRKSRERELVYHKRHLDAAEKSYEAYKVQYQMGKQRTLFDLLNARSEFFVARFSVIDIQFSIKSSEFRILAAMGKLVDYIKTAD